MTKKSKKPRLPKPKKRRVNVMVVPHGGGRSRTVFVHGAVLAGLLLASVVVLVLAGLMVSDYWRNIIKLSQLVAYERRETEETHKLDVMERGLADLDAKVEEVEGQYDELYEGHRLHEVKTPEGLLPEDAPARNLSLPELERRVARLEKNLGVVRGRFDEDPGAPASLPSIMPCPGWLYRDFGNTVSPFTGRVEMHRGVDVAAPRGTPLVAAAAGVVTAEGLEEHYGLTVEIDHGNGFVTRYAHNMRNAVRVGGRVKRGQVIAYVGSTGRSSSTHVHYEVLRNGVPLNPRFFILREPKSPRELKPSEREI
jgi:murein DD-endopeptidase MepM/ murein hydrolase activator NlpD